MGLLFLGAFSRGHYFAYGDDTKALVALASTKAEGTWAELLPIPFSKAESLYLTLKDNIPSRLSWTIGIVKKTIEPLDSLDSSVSGKHPHAGF